MDVGQISTALLAERQINENPQGIWLNLERELDHLHRATSDPKISFYSRGSSEKHMW